jgi:hypothetical protein
LATAMDDLVDVMKAIKNNKRFANNSNTSGAMFVHQLISTVFGSGLGGAATGDGMGAMIGGVAVAGGTHLGAAGLGKLMMHGPFVKWLAEPVMQSSRYTIKQHFVKLGTIAATAPHLRESIDNFVTTFRSVNGIQEQNQ